MNVDMSGPAIEARLRETSRLAGSLRPEARLETKLDMSGTAIAARLREASDLLDLCRKLTVRPTEVASGTAIASAGLLRKA